MSNTSTVDALREDQILDAELLGHRLHLHSTWGLFSPRRVDEGTLLLLDHLEVARDEIALDIGCGYGPLGLAIAASAPEGRVHLIDKDFVAVDYARANAARNGLGNTEVYLSNAFSHVPADLPLSLVVSNLPAKVGNEMFHITFTDAKARMQPGARIVVVTINGLRQYVRRAFREIFGNYDKLKQGKSYTVSLAVRE
ncbi:MAG: methyltransferase [Gammaproteobacteria bacterium]|nr:MAG: methyltransferase [Gammaproteobacteria bacterium]